MGKRKSSKKVMKKERPKVMGKFDCPFCNHAGSIKVTINKKAKTGECRCTVCNAHYATHVTALSEPIDIFCEWVDEAEKLNAPSEQPKAPERPARSRQPASRGHDDDDDDDDDEGGSGSDGD